jgi:hypothetical protein
MLSNGRVVANPLATVIRFAFPTRGEGQNRTPAQHRWNLRAGREFAFRGFRLEASIDVLNVTNLGRFSNWNFTGANQTYSPFYNRLIFRQAPRQATLGLRLIF